MQKPNQKAHKSISEQHDFNIQGANLSALGSGALWWPDHGVLTVSDLHLGKSERIARRGGPLLPPFETQETLSKLENDIAAADPSIVVCLGDSFDDDAAGRNLDDESRLWITRLQAGRNWIWIEGNHDPGPVALPGSHRGEFQKGSLVFRHIAEPAGTGEVSGHYHPKISIAGQSRRCFVYDTNRVLLPAYGAYTGGLKCSDPALQRLFSDPAFAVLTGTKPRVVPLPR